MASAQTKLIAKLDELIANGESLKGVYRRDAACSLWEVRCGQILSLLGNETKEEFQMTGAMVVAHSGMNDAVFERHWQGELVEKIQFLQALKEKLELFTPDEEQEVTALKNALGRLHSKPGS